MVLYIISLICQIVNMFFCFVLLQDVESLKAAAQKELKNLLQSHFPEISISEEKDFTVWVKNFVAEVDKKVGEKSSTADFKAETEQLEKQANHYKAILSETVSN